MIQNFVISVKTATKRREHIMCEFGKQGIAFEFFDAVTPTDISKYAQKLSIPIINNQRLTDGEKACFLSHVALWQQMIDENLDYMAIFEDDVYLGNDAACFIKNDWLYFEFDIIKLETQHELVHIGKSIHHHGNRTLNPLKSTHVGTAGYIISQSGAKRLLEFIKSIDEYEYYAIDHVMFGAYLSKGKVLQLCPALCQQSDSQIKNLESQLEQDRKNYQYIYHANESLYTKLNKIVKRFYRSFGKRFFYITVAFR